MRLQVRESGPSGSLSWVWLTFLAGVIVLAAWLAVGATAQASVSSSMLVASPFTPVELGAPSSSNVASAWGKDEGGQLGDGLKGSEFNSAVPVLVSGLTGVKTVAATYRYGLALLENGTVAAWGADTFGQLGNGVKTESEDAPVMVCAVGEKAPCAKPLSGVKAIAAGGYHSSMALLENGTVVAWGGRLGNGSETEESSVPVEVKGLSGVRAISSGEHTSLALLENNTVKAWGYDVGDGPESSSLAPVTVCAQGETAPCSPLSEVTAVSAGPFFSLALLANGNVLSWGYGGSGRLGNGKESSPSPAPVCAVGETLPCSNGLGGVKAISAGGGNSTGEALALLDNGTVVGWGFGRALGNGTREEQRVPKRVCAAGEAAPCSHQLGEVTAISMGEEIGLALLSNGTVMSWGSNLEGGLGNPAAGKESFVPVPVKGLKGIVAVAAGSGQAYAAGEPPESVPQVKGLEPSFGPSAGGTAVTISGLDLGSVTAVKFGSANATSFKVESENTISAVAPPGTGTVDVTVTAPTGTSPTSSSDRYRYAPAIAGISPARGLPAGGSTVTITGTNFNTVSGVTFGSQPAASFKVESETRITAVSPPGTGTVNVAVTTSGGESAFNGFTYTAVPGITAVEPNHGSPLGGTTVTIRGTSFTSGTSAVRFGGNNALSFKVESENKITAVSPPFSGGGEDAVFLFVTTPGGTNEPNEVGGTEQVGFIYEPTVRKIEPHFGPSSGGTSVRISGEAFEGTVRFAPPLESLLEPVTQFVEFGETAAKSVNIVSPTEIVAVAPAGTGTEDVKIRTTFGHSRTNASDLFSFGPAVTSVTPSSGLTKANTSVTITGANFTEVKGVRFGSTPVTGAINVESESKITVTAPPGSSGPVNVTVETNGGTSPINVGDVYTYLTSLQAGHPEVVQNGITVPGKKGAAIADGSGELTLHSAALGGEGVECVNTAFGGAWNEGPPARGVGQVLGWSAAAHAPSEAGMGVGTSCRTAGGAQPATFLTAEAPVPQESNERGELQTADRQLSTPWNVEVGCGEREGEGDQVIVKIGVPDSQFPMATAGCVSEPSEGTVLAYQQEREERTGCYASNPSPEGCLRFTLVQPATGLELAYGGTLRALGTNGVHTALSPSTVTFEGERLGALQCEFPTGCSETATVTGEARVWGEGPKLIQAK